jgi:hypothetical protein
VDRALTLLAAAQPGTPAEDLALLTLGARNARLIALREQTFGPRLDVVADCPRCAEQLEFGLSTFDLTAQPAEGEDGAALEVESGGQRLGFRPVDSRDLAAIVGCQDPGEARQLLARRCLSEPNAGDLPPDVVDELARRLAECDRQAEILLDLACPSCGHAWQLAFDIGSFLWAELSAEAQRLFHEIDALARAYGWREADILALSPARRHLYLEMVS